jgi:hypothetical protein
MRASVSERMRNRIEGIESSDPRAYGGSTARRRDIQILHRKSGVRAIFASFQTRIFIETNTKSVLLIRSFVQ